MRRDPYGRRDPALVLLILFAITVCAILLAVAVVLSAAIMTAR